MQLMQEIPDCFWSLFRSCNRQLYMEALLEINDEYQYNNYFLSWESCIQVLGNYFSQRRIQILKDELESDTDVLEPPATRILSWLIKAQWLKVRNDYKEGIRNIVIPDYAAVFVDSFETLMNEDTDETDIYIQSIYAILFSYRNDKRSDTALLSTALANTKKLNKALQNMLHNMDKFFAALLDQEFYGDLLQEHLNGYVEEIVKKKYHILKTTDNFYQYKMDIKTWLREMAEEESQNTEGSNLLELIEAIERGFRDIERRIFYMDKEHSKYVRATVARLNYLLNEERDTKGLLVQLLNSIAASKNAEEQVKKVGEQLNFSQFSILSGKSLYKRRRPQTPFMESLEPEEELLELSKEDVLKLNKIQNRYSKKQVEDFIESRMEQGVYQVSEDTVSGVEDFEKLILAYDYSFRKDSKFKVIVDEERQIESKMFCYPCMRFVRRA